MDLIKQYVRKGTKQVGVLVGVKTDSGKVNVGWSKCTLRRNGEQVDQYDRDFGVNIAIERANNPRQAMHGTTDHQIPYIVRKQLADFKERCMRYFKTKKVTVHGEEKPANDDLAKMVAKVRKGLKPLKNKK